MPIQKWEYKFEIFAPEDFASRQYNPVPLAQQTMSEHGEAGWELVSAIETNGGRGYKLFLKRPKQ